MVLNSGIGNITVIVNCGQWSDVIIHDINIDMKEIYHLQPRV